MFFYLYWVWCGGFYDACSIVIVVVVIRSTINMLNTCLFGSFSFLVFLLLCNMCILLCFLLSVSIFVLNLMFLLHYICFHFHSIVCDNQQLYQIFGLLVVVLRYLNRYTEASYLLLVPMFLLALV